MPKKMIPAPIDRPLSRAYLREFSGWSTAYPPGISEPTSLRVMENAMVNRDGSVRVRPGLRHLSQTEDDTPVSEQLVGTHEAFYLNDGSKAYLFAVREDDDTVGFRVYSPTLPSGIGNTVWGLTDTGIDFDIPQGEAAIRFTSATTYVKYLQIDNKIFALSNAGETMRLFEVGSSKSAKKLLPVVRPSWTLDDKLTVVEPEESWISAGVLIGIRANVLRNPSFEDGLTNWTCTGSATTATSPTPQDRTKVLQLSTQAQRTNLCPSPLYDVVSTGITGWVNGSRAVVGPSGADLSIDSPAGVAGRSYYADPVSAFAVTPGLTYVAAIDVDYVSPNTAQVGFLWRFYDSTGTRIGSDVTTNVTALVGRRVSAGVAAPAGAVTARCYLRGATSVFAAGKTDAGWAAKNMVVCLSSESTAMFSGATGADYYWLGTTNDSASVYHPAQSVSVSQTVTVAAGAAGVGSAYIQAGSTGRTATLTIDFSNGTSSTGSVTPAAVADVSGSWTRLDASTVAVPAGSTLATWTLTFASVARAEFHYVDATMYETGVSVVDTYFDGDTTDTSTVTHSYFDGASFEYTSTLGSTLPTAETPTADTLISSAAADNIYNFGFFYTFSNEVGESAASQVTVVRTQRPWSGWRWETPNASGEPSGTATSDPTLAADQLVAYMPLDVFTDALAQGAISWSLYMFTWSDQDPVPAAALKISERGLTSASDHDSVGWGRATPVVNETAKDAAVLPSIDNRYNYSNPSSGGQGIVAADRMVLVNDPNAAAVIRWSANQQGDYSNFTASKGGGYKTLTSGNLFIPACVKLWQNPQSVDTLTILCTGTDGHTTGYYMAPAQVASQSQAVNVMGFEETTATPGTTSPFGCEVFNNALYHPLDDQLMKSTATNYNINHKSQSDAIRNVWERLERKDRIVSSVHDNRLYYIVNNPDGEVLEDGCWGNEIWVLDAGVSSDKGGGTWSRWLVQAHSLRKIQYGNRVYMSVVRPDGIFYLDPDVATDDYVEDGVVLNRPVTWYLETNTQGANRAHDAWAHLQQANIVVGNFSGQMRYGVRGLDFNGKPVDISKILRDDADPETLTYDLEDFLLIRRDMKEWFFYAGSVIDDEGVVAASSGQVSLVQYRYTPSTVNTGYEFGSVETFEYGRAAVASDSNTTSGTPVPYIDTRRP